MKKEDKKFELLAIRPLGDDEKFLKVLTTGYLYKFYGNYEFLDSENKEVVEGKEVNTIKKKGPDLDLFNLQTSQSHYPKINISAIVGKNGSGKSTLIELLYMAVYVVGTKMEFLHGVEYHKDKIAKGLKKFEESKEKLWELSSKDDLEKSKQQFEISKDRHERQIIKLNSLYSKVKMELYYRIGDDYYCLKIDNNDVDLKPTENSSVVVGRNYKICNIFNQKDNFLIENFFYSVALNYSVYGLNSTFIDSWIEDLFHKNDGYRTPLVINPMRTEGNFDINNETYLSQSRILTNLIDDTMVVKDLIENKKVKEIRFEFISQKTEEFYSINFQNIIDKFEKGHKISVIQFTEKLLKSILKLKENEITKIKSKGIKHFNEITKYLLKKVFKVARTYDEYKKYYLLPESPSVPIPELKEIDGLIKDLSDDNSHKTLKLRQVLNLLRFDLLKEGKGIKWIGNSLNVPLSELIERVKKAKKVSKCETIELVPAAYYAPNIVIEYEAGFHELSSGEQQMINVLQTIYYHLINLNSVFKSTIEGDKKPNKFHLVSIIIDEVELYFHPDFQKKFILEFLNGISRLNIPNILGLNVLISTHSPFVLSDLPQSNVLCLTLDGSRKSVSENFKNETFGANIHDLLANDFFLRDGFMGEFAKSKINEVINWVNYELLDKESKSLDALANKKNTKLKIDEIAHRKKLVEIKEALLDDKNIDLNIEKCTTIIDSIGELSLKNKLTAMISSLAPADENVEYLKELETVREKYGKK